MGGRRPSLIWRKKREGGLSGARLKLAGVTKSALTQLIEAPCDNDLQGCQPLDLMDGKRRWIHNCICSCSLPASSTLSHPLCCVPHPQRSSVYASENGPGKLVINCFDISAIIETARS